MGACRVRLVFEPCDFESEREAWESYPCGTVTITPVQGFALRRR